MVGEVLRRQSYRVKVSGGREMQEGNRKRKKRQERHGEGEEDAGKWGNIILFFISKCWWETEGEAVG